MANRVNPINPADVNMKVNIAGVEFNNPVTVASGTFGSGMEYCEYVDLNKLGAVTTKGVANVPWPGNPTPRIAETYGGMINAIGLQNPGLDTFVKRDIPFLKQYDTKIIVNVCGKTEEDYVDAVEKLGEQPVDMLEINISCPNVKEGGIAFGQVPASAERITKAVKKVARQPVIMKLSPNVTDITEMAKAVEAGGADAVLLSRISANLRRRDMNSGDVYNKGSLSVHFDQYKLYRDGKELKLSSNEWDIIKILIENKGRVVRRDVFFDRLWDMHGNYVEYNTLTVTMSRLKAKLGTFSDEHIPYIETIRNVGYRWIV